MIALALAAFLSSPAGATGEPVDTVVSTQVVIAQTRVIRVPTRRSRRYRPMLGPADPRLPAPPRFRERHGPHCIAGSEIAGAAIASPDSVDFILRGGHRVRARLEEACPALDYYSGFYVKPPQDGQICAGRDSIRTRSGGECVVDRFHTLIPIPPHR